MVGVGPQKHQHFFARQLSQGNYYKLFRKEKINVLRKREELSIDKKALEAIRVQGLGFVRIFQFGLIYMYSGTG